MYMPKCIELVTCDWLICVDKWPVSVDIYIEREIIYNVFYASLVTITREVTVKPGYNTPLVHTLKAGCVNISSVVQIETVVFELMMNVA